MISGNLLSTEYQESSHVKIKMVSGNLLSIEYYGTSNEKNIRNILMYRNQETSCLEIEIISLSGKVLSTRILRNLS